MSEDRKNSLWLGGQYVTVILSSFIILKLCLSHFGTELFGIWIVLASFWGFSALLDLGFGTSVIRYISQKREDRSEIEFIVRAGLILFISAGLILFFSAQLISDYIFFSNSKLIPDQYQQAARSVFIILGVHFLCQYLGLFFRAVIEGLNNFVLSSQIIILYNLLILVSVCIVVWSNYSLEVLAGAYLSSSLITLSITLISVIYKYKINLFRSYSFPFNILKQIFKYSLSIQFSSLMGALLDPLIKYIIGNFGSLSMVSYFEIARRFSTALIGLFTTSFRYYLPKTSRLNNKEDFRKFLNIEGVMLSRMGIVYSTLVFGVMQFFIISIIKIWFGYDQVILVFLILSLAEIINSFGYILYVFILGIGKASFLIFMQLTNLIFTSILVTIGIIFFNSLIGLLGSFLSSIIVSISMLYYIKRIANFSITNYLKSVNIKKLIYLSSFLILTIFSIYLNLFPLFPTMLIFSSISLILFIKDIKDTFIPLIKYRYKF